MISVPSDISTHVPNSKIREEDGTLQTQEEEEAQGEDYKVYQFFSDKMTLTI